METSSSYFVFGLADQRYALPLSSVLKVIRAVALVPLPEAPENVSGLLNMGGEIIPVLNIRGRFHLPDRDLDLEDRIVICKGAAGKVAFAVDLVVGVVAFSPEEMDDADDILPRMDQYVEGVGKLNCDTVLVYDLDKLFSIGDVEDLPITRNLEGTQGSNPDCNDAPP